MASVILISSCEKDDGYSLNEMWLTTGTVMKTSDYFYIQTDGDLSLWPSASNVDPVMLEHGLRVIVNYTILGDATDNDTYDYYVKINAVDDILTKPVFTFTNETTDEVIDSIGNDPVFVKSTWFTDDYLSVEFEYGGGGYVVHYINLVYDLENHETGNGEVLLELKHNANNDEYNYKQWGIASFDISELQQEGKDSIDIVLRSLTNDGELEYAQTITYVYDPKPELYKNIFNLNRLEAPYVKIK